MPGTFWATLRVMRPHQWVKNLLVFLPLAAAHRFAQWPSSFWMFVAFCLTASSGYVLNDLLDQDADRHHPTKKNRPLATGALTARFGTLLVPVLFASGILILCLGSPSPLAVAVLLSYFAATFAYSLHLKKILLLDAFTLTGLYILRIVAGHVAADVPFSFWLLAFAAFLFFSLALAKRCAELRVMGGAGETELRGRGYALGDLAMLQTFGVASGFVATLVLALYVTSDSARTLYAEPLYLWLLCPLLLYWLCRVWIICHRGLLHDDPVAFAIRDRVTYLVAALALVIVLAAANGGVQPAFRSRARPPGAPGILMRLTAGSCHGENVL